MESPKPAEKPRINLNTLKKIISGLKTLPKKISESADNKRRNIIAQALI
jgi:hypothetical protein